MMIKCPECGREISSKATSCPHCGCPISEASSKVIDAKVEPAETKPAPRVEPQYDEKEIQQYEREIDSCRRKRKAMIGWGIALNVIGIIGIIVFSILLALGLAREIPNAEANPEFAGKIVGIAVLYYAMIILFAFMLAGGEVLIVLGAVVNSIKIKKRENRIRAFRANK